MQGNYHGSANNYNNNNTAGQARHPHTGAGWSQEAQNNQARGHFDHTKIQCYNCQGWGHMWHEYPSTCNLWLGQPLNGGRRKNPRPSPCSQ